MSIDNGHFMLSTFANYQIVSLNANNTSQVLFLHKLFCSSIMTLFTRAFCRRSYLIRASIHSLSFMFIATNFIIFKFVKIKDHSSRMNHECLICTVAKVKTPKSSNSTSGFLSRVEIWHLLNSLSLWQHSRLWALTWANCLLQTCCIKIRTTKEDDYCNLIRTSANLCKRTSTIAKKCFATLIFALAQNTIKCS